MDFSTSTTVLLTDKALFFSIAVSVFFLLFLTALMVVFVFRYSRKRRLVSSGTTGHFWLEVTWIVVPTALALVMFVQGLAGYSISRTPPPGAMEVTVVARMWQWMFEYPNQRVSPVLYLPAGKPVKLLLESKDVVHGFFVPAFRVKQDVLPSGNNHVTFTPLETGTYDIFCTEYCGTGHSAMNSSVVVMRPGDFYAWLKTIPPQKPVKVGDILAGTPEQLPHGKDVYLVHCVTCHGPDGRGEGLPGARNFTGLAGWKNGPKTTQMFRTVSDGLGEQMPSFLHLPVEDRFAAIHYVRAFATGQPPDTPEEIQQLDRDFSLSLGKAAPPEISIEDAMHKLAAETTGTLQSPAGGTREKPGGK